MNRLVIRTDQIARPGTQACTSYDVAVARVSKVSHRWMTLNAFSNSFNSSDVAALIKAWHRSSSASRSASVREARHLPSGEASSTQGSSFDARASSRCRKRSRLIAERPSVPARRGGPRVRRPRSAGPGLPEYLPTCFRLGGRVGPVAHRRKLREFAPNLGQAGKPANARAGGLGSLLTQLTIPTPKDTVSAVFDTDNASRLTKIKAIVAGTSPVRNLEGQLQVLARRITLIVTSCGSL